ncbi:unnamed protein product, partial [Brassica oleracea]
GWALLPASHHLLRWSAGLWLWRRTSNSGVIISFWHRVTLALSSPVIIIIGGYLRTGSCSGVVPVEHQSRSSGGDAPVDEVRWMLGSRACVHLR